MKKNVRQSNNKKSILTDRLFFKIHSFKCLPDKIIHIIIIINFYSYRISDQGDAEWKTIRVPPPETTNTFTLYNLQSDNEYEFQVYATNRLGAGQPSPIIRASTKRMYH